MWITASVREVNAADSSLVISTGLGVTEVAVDGPCAEQVDNRWKGAEVGLFASEGRTRLISLLPSQVLDVTEVAECVTGSNCLPDLAILRRLEPRKASYAALRGSLINSAFDQLVRSPTLSNAEVIDHAVISRALAIAALGKEAQLRDAIEDVLPAIRAMLTKWQGMEISVEQHTISGMIGLQGRFDILLMPPGSRHAELVELKSGSVPRSVRPSHEAQLSAYALLHKLLHGSDPSSSSIWYLADRNGPLREVQSPAMSASQEKVLATRNGIILREQELVQRNFAVLREFTGNHLRAAGPAATFEDEFSTAYQHVDSLSRTTYQAWLYYLATEQTEVRDGNNQRRTSADLWRHSQSEKTHSTTVLQHLVVNPSLSDFENMHIVFECANTVDNTALRVADLVFFHKYEQSADTGEFRQDLRTVHIIKATVRAVQRHRIEVSVRNKQVPPEELCVGEWTMEQDVTTAGISHLSGSLAAFLQATPQRRHAILGATVPRFDKPPLLTSPKLTESQATAVAGALSARDWYLVQGPPGTGKTSRVLREIVVQLLGDGSQNNTAKERVLVLAYTNRAVNEICSVLDAVLPAGTILRHGSALGIEPSLAHLSIPHIARHTHPDKLAELLRGARCIVSTIQAMHSQPEIYAFGKFTTAVVDESSQVLDVQIVGILANVQRHILIGDHAQLPPVVQQTQTQLSVSSTTLAGIGIAHLGASIFERLATVCDLRGWKGAKVMLEGQGRMHADVVRFPSEAFYEGRLSTIAAWQTNEAFLPWSAILPRRTAFIHIQRVQQEATIAAELAQRIFRTSRDRGLNYSIGIITPFRVQNQRIALLLSDEERQAISVDTVERYQGSERDIIIYATSVGSAQEFDTIRADLGSIDRKLNVASTRAREQFVMIGNRAILTLSAAYTQAIESMVEVSADTLQQTSSAE